MMHETPNDPRISQLYQSLAKQQVTPTIEQHILQMAEQQANINRTTQGKSNAVWQKISSLFSHSWQSGLAFAGVVTVICAIVFNTLQPSDNIYSTKEIIPPTEAELQAQTWAELRTLIAQKKYDEAREQLNNIRQRNPQVVVPQDITQALDTSTKTP